MKRFIFFIALIALLPVLSRPGCAAGGTKQAAVAQRAEAAPPADFVGSEVCETCHAEVAKKFENNPHNKITLTHGAGTACERSEEHTSELQSLRHLVCRLLL